MKDRASVVRFIEKQLHYTYECKREKYGRTYYGFQELCELMDFIYNGEPCNNKEVIVKKNTYRKD